MKPESESKYPHAGTSAKNKTIYDWRQTFQRITFMSYIDSSTFDLQLII